jgi:hypothetical protein
VVGALGVGGGEIADVLKLGTRVAGCELIATVHRPGGVLPRSGARRITERLQRVAEQLSYAVDPGAMTVSRSQRSTAFTQQRQLHLPSGVQLRSRHNLIDSGDLPDELASDPRDQGLGRSSEAARELARRPRPDGFSDLAVVAGRF